MQVDHAARSATQRPGAWRPVAWRPLIAVLAVMAFLVGGWLLISAPLSDTEPVAAGRTLSLGSGDQTATVTVPENGWQLHKAATNLNETYNLSRAGVELAMSYIQLPGIGNGDDLWPGFGKVTKAQGGTLGAPQPISTSAGRPGQSGPLEQGGKTGTGYAFGSPDGKYAVEFTVLGQTDDAAAAPARASAEQIVRSLTFAGSQS